MSVPEAGEEGGKGGKETTEEGRAGGQGQAHSEGGVQGFQHRWVSFAMPISHQGVHMSSRLKSVSFTSTRSRHWILAPRRPLR